MTLEQALDKIEELEKDNEELVDQLVELKDKCRNWDKRIQGIQEEIYLSY